MTGAGDGGPTGSFASSVRAALTAAVFLPLGIAAFRGVRWAYALFVALGLLYFPARVGFHLDPQPCEVALDVPLALFSLTNFSHIVLFGIFFAMTSAQLRDSLTGALAWSAGATLAMGVLVEAAEAVTGRGHCRVRDLVPDAAGGLICAAIVTLWRRLRSSAQAARSGTSE